jgi:sulfate adenylyltransferase subunit 1
VSGIFIAGSTADVAAAGCPVTLTLDREVDVSRGCVLTSDTQIATAKKFCADLLWMDDQNLATGVEYWIKIGTKLTVGVINSVLHKIDVNTGEKLHVLSLSKNEIAACEIVLTQDVTIDEFDSHKTLGELILIDRVTHATSACGVVTHIDVHVTDGTIFESEGQNVTLRLFDTFYYEPEIHAIMRHDPENKVYHVGDILPLEAYGHHYPQNFDVRAGDLSLHIRNGRFTGFGNHDEVLPLLDERGFRLDRTSDRPFEEYHTVVIQ